MTFQNFSKTQQLLSSSGQWPRAQRSSSANSVDVEHFYDILSRHFFPTVYNYINIYNYLPKSCFLCPKSDIPQKGHMVISNTGVVSLDKLRPLLDDDFDARVFQVWGQSWFRAAGKSAGSLQLAVHQGDKHFANTLQCQKAFPDTFALDFSASHHGTIMAEVLLHRQAVAAGTHRDRPGPNDDE